MLLDYTFEEIKEILGTSLIELEDEFFIVDTCEICRETFFKKIYEKDGYILFSSHCEILWIL